MDLLNTSDFISEVREQVDEENTEARGDSAILSMANRGVREAAHILSIHYPDLLMSSPYDLTLQSGVQDYAMPADCYEGKVVYIEIVTPGTPMPTVRHSFRDGTRLSMPGTTPIPFTWEVRGKKIHFHQAPSGTYTARLYYARTPDPLASVQGRITSVAVDGSYVIVDNAGADLSAAIEDLGNVVNVINWNTGEVRATLQLQSVISNKLTFRSSPTRPSIRGRTVSSAVSVDPTSDACVTADDYVCISSGTCVPFFQGVIYNYLVEYAVAGVSRSLSQGDMSTQLNQQVLAAARDMVEDQWAGQELQERVRSRSSAWQTNARRFPWSNG